MTIQWTSQTVAMRSRLLREDTYMPSDSQTTRPATPADIAEWADQASPDEYATVLGCSIERGAREVVTAALAREERALVELGAIHGKMREILEIGEETTTTATEAASTMAVYVSVLKARNRVLNADLDQHRALLERALSVGQQAARQTEQLMAIITELKKVKP